MQITEFTLNIEVPGLDSKNVVWKTLIYSILLLHRFCQITYFTLQET